MKSMAIRWGLVKINLLRIQYKPKQLIEGLSHSPRYLICTCHLTPLLLRNHFGCRYGWLQWTPPSISKTFRASNNSSKAFKQINFRRWFVAIEATEGDDVTIRKLLQRLWTYHLFRKQDTEQRAYSPAPSRMANDAPKVPQPEVRLPIYEVRFQFSLIEPRAAFSSQRHSAVIGVG